MTTDDLSTAAIKAANRMRENNREVYRVMFPHVDEQKLWDESTDKANVMARFILSLSNVERSAFTEWTCVFPGKMSLSWKRAWDGVGTKAEAEAQAAKNCNVVAVPLELFEKMKEHERRMIAAETCATLGCGHHVSNLDRTVESGTAFCRLCDLESRCRDAEKQERELAAENARLRELIIRIREWDALPMFSDGRFWLSEIDAALAATAPKET